MDWLEDKDFYELMQAYRFAPITDQAAVVAAFEAVKQAIRDKMGRAMTDKELLEFAAKAAGRMVLGWYNGEPTYAILEDESSWNPLLRDGDALRLALACGLQVREREARWCPSQNHAMRVIVEDALQDPHASTRRAITRAAAEIGKSMP